MVKKISLKKKMIAFSVLLVGVVSGIFHFQKDVHRGLIENSTHHKISPNGSTIIAYDSIPIWVINSAKSYIMTHNLNSSDIIWAFANSRSTYNPEFPDAQDEGLYYVFESYQNIDVRGYFAINNFGQVTKSEGIKSQKELAEIQISPDIGSLEAVTTARDYLNLKSNTPATIIRRCLETDPNNSEFVFCYKIHFNDDTPTLYVDGVAGNIIKQE